MHERDEFAKCALRVGRASVRGNKYLVRSIFGFEVEVVVSIDIKLGRFEQ